MRRQSLVDWGLALTAIARALGALGIVPVLALCTAPVRAPVVLCIGDSLTWGLGAANGESYPDQLRALLEDAGRPEKVINGGLVAQNSREILLELPHQLQRFRPTVVYAMAGLLDAIERPRLVSDDELRAAAPEPSVAAAAGQVPPWVGTWTNDTVTVVLTEDGRLFAPPLVGRIRSDGDRLLLRAPTGETKSLEWSLEGEFLSLWLPGSAPLRLARSDEARPANAVREPAAGDDLPDLLALLDAEPERAAANLRAAYAATPEDELPARRMLAHALAAHLRRRDPAAALLWLVRAHQLGAADEQMIVEHLRGFAPARVQTAVTAAAAQAAADPAWLAALAARAAEPVDDWAGVLLEHLAQMRSLCADADAELVLVLYPDADVALRDCYQRAAADLGLRLLDADAAFADYRRASHQPLMIGNGHCTAAGYRVLAELIAADL